MILCVYVLQMYASKFRDNCCEDDPSDNDVLSPGIRCVCICSGVCSEV